jgi:hypothetical protein
MPYQPFLIAPLQIGLERDIQPWLLPEEAYSDLENMYVYRGRLKQRLGFSHLGEEGRFIREISSVILSTQASGASYSNSDLLNDSSINVRSGAPNCSLKPGSLSITVGTITFSDNGDGTLSGIPATNSGTINYQTGALSLTFNPSLGAPTNVVVNFLWFPSLPVMGFGNRDVPTISREQLIGFDQTSAYFFDGGANTWVEVPPSSPFTGSDSAFFWSTNYWQDANNISLFWATNNVIADRINYFNGTNWTQFSPQLDSTSTRFLRTSLIIIPYKERLVVLNTQEETGTGVVNFPQRARWCQIGDPLQTNAWQDDIQGKGNFIDAATNEHIVTAFFYNDVLLVGFERSLWQLRYTGNRLLPFIWQRISAELGAESTFSQVAFDQGVTMISNRAIINATSTNATRIDAKIPDEVFNFHNENDGPKRVHGVRDFRNELAYWTFPSAAKNKKFPDKLLVLNYREGSWSFFKDSFTVLSNFQRFNDITWAGLRRVSWESLAVPWNDPSLQSEYPDIVAGNQNGFTVVLNKKTINDSSLYVTNISIANPAVVTSSDHNLENNTFIRFTGVIGPSLNDKTYLTKNITQNTFELWQWDPSIQNAVPVENTNTYLGGGEIIVLTNINVKTKKFNFFKEQGTSLRIPYIDLLMSTTENGQISLDIIYNEADFTNITLQIPTTQVSEQISGQNFYWQRVYLDTIAQLIQFRMYLSNDQMNDFDIVSSLIEQQGLMIWAESTGRLIG